jgi:hypothetical protein
MAQQKTGDHNNSRDEPNRWLQDTSGSIIGRATTNRSRDQRQRSEIDSLVTPSRAVGQDAEGAAVRTCAARDHLERMVELTGIVGAAQREKYIY